MNTCDPARERHVSLDRMEHQALNDLAIIKGNAQLLTRCQAYGQLFDERELRRRSVAITQATTRLTHLFAELLEQRRATEE